MMGPIPDQAVGVHEPTSPAKPVSSTKSPSFSPETSSSDLLSTNSNAEVPPCLLSPAFTPPSTPGTSTPRTSTQAGVLSTHDQDLNIQSSLLETLPEVECQVRARIPMNNGRQFFLYLYRNNIDNKEHLAIVFGDTIRSKSLDAPRQHETEMDRMTRGAYTGRLFPGRTASGPEPSSQSSTQQAATPIPLVRIHSECYTGETAWSARCDCGEQLDEAARLMSAEGNGVVVYLRQEGRGIGLAEKLKAYNLQDLGNDTVTANLLLRHPADARSYGLATSILLDLGLSTIRLLTNNPVKVAAVEGPNKEILVKERVPMVPLAWKGIKGGITGTEINDYLNTKVSRPLSSRCTCQVCFWFG
ncbi:GTP cyclohydrolase II, variant 2 [Orbilia brochopaga]|uniref:GTP cyclohydrolase II n=1 Tax=Orbilia brochopaga TaxID=3140254 RepID=A0AAV9TVD2_9PEZI